MEDDGAQRRHRGGCVVDTNLEEDREIGDGKVESVSPGNRSAAIL